MQPGRSQRMAAPYSLTRRRMWRGGALSGDVQRGETRKDSAESASVRWRALARRYRVLVAPPSRAASRSPARPPHRNGVVVIKTTLGYQRAGATGTGMVLTSSGKILTNNHVIRGATQDHRRRPGNEPFLHREGRRLRRADDVAVLRADGASNLETVKSPVPRSPSATGSRPSATQEAPARSTAHGLDHHASESIMVRDDTGGADGSPAARRQCRVVPGDSAAPAQQRQRRDRDEHGRIDGYASRSDTQVYAIPIAQGALDRPADRGRARVCANPHRSDAVPRRPGRVRLRNGDFRLPGRSSRASCAAALPPAAGVPGDVITSIDGRRSPRRARSLQRSSPRSRAPR